MDQKDKKAIELAKNYMINHYIDNGFEIFIVWKAKILKNWKYLISSTIPDGFYIELTYNGNSGDWYLDAYKKFENVCIPD